MTNKQLLRAANKDIDNRGNVDWYRMPSERMAPERQLRIPLVRGSSVEIEARSFFERVAHDAELLGRRAGILLTWAQQRTPELYARRSEIVLGGLK